MHRSFSSNQDYITDHAVSHSQRILCRHGLIVALCENVSLLVEVANCKIVTVGWSYPQTVCELSHYQLFVLQDR
jgi:hypothetical protein